MTFRSSFNSQARRKILGQHMLVSEGAAQALVDSAGIQESDTVFEIGTGLGIVTKYVAEKASQVITCDVDSNLVSSAKEKLAGLKNIRFVHGDAFRLPLSQTGFDVCITSLPYSRSRDFVEWASRRAGTFRVAVAIVQSEFAQKLLAVPATSSYRAISVIAQLSFQIEELFGVSRECFSPPPKVTSECIKLFPKEQIQSNNILSSKDKALIKGLFSSRRKTLKAGLRNADMRNAQIDVPKEIFSRRIDTLSPEEFLLLVRKRKEVMDGSIDH